MGAAQHRGGGIHRAVESEGLGNEVDVVVNGLGNADNADMKSPPENLPPYGGSGFHAAISSDDEEHADVQTLQGIHDFPGILRAAG